MKRIKMVLGLAFFMSIVDIPEVPDLPKDMPTVKDIISPLFHPMLQDNKEKVNDVIEWPKTEAPMCLTVDCMPGME